MNELRDVFTKYKAVVFFDTETTGLEAESCQIIELAAIRVEKTERGTLRMADSADVFVKLPEGERIPQKIVELTGITDEQLENEGITEAEAAARFTELISGGRVLLVAHNAQFDLLFTAEMLRRHGNGGPEALKAADYLDSLTVYKDRRAYPHKLANAILTYKLEDKVQNSHRAIDDVAALFEVCKAMDAERSDLLSYVNVFGYNPKYGVSGKRIEKVAYWPQNFNKYMQAPSYTDYRLTYLIGTTNETQSKYYTLKYNPSVESVVEAMENPMIPVIRFSEICHILAEISSYNGKITDGINYLETVRKARGAERTLSLTVSTREQLDAEILLDIRKEMIGEGGTFYTYKRMNLSTVPDSDEEGEINMAGSYVLPLPASETTN